MILRKGQIWEIRQRLLFHFSYCLGFVGGEEGTEGLWAKVIEDRCGKCLWGSDESNLFLALLFLLSGNVSNDNAIGYGVCVVSLC